MALFRPYRRRLSALLALIIVSAGISMISPFLLRDLLDNVLTKGSHLDTTRLAFLVGGMVVIPIITGAIGVAQTWQSNLIGQQVMHDLRASVYSHLQRLSLAFFTRTRTGEVQSRIANDIGGVQTVVTTTATSIVSNATTVLATTVAMTLLEWRLTLASFAILPLFVWMTRRVGRVRKAITATKQGSLADISTLVEESLSVSGVLLAKTMGQTGELTGRFTEESRRLADLELRQRMAGRWMMATIQSTFAIMPALMYGIAGLTMSRGGGLISIGTLVAFTTLQTRLLFPIGSLLNVQADLQTSTALFDRVFEYLDLPVEIDERDDPVTLDPATTRGEVEFRQVGFRYEENGATTLRDISFVAPPGTKVAVVGETGSGKTTLGYLTARLYDVTEGSVTIDGVDVRDLTFDSLRATIGVVSQETYLFHGSVRENLRFARPGASDEELEAAARAAQIHHHLASLPDGYDTVVGERGYRFSGGEKQRLAIARAILRDPPVLVLDEATSALDVETERAVQEALERLSAGRTTIAIAHRLSTIRNADLILVLDGGEIIERGSHDELLAIGGRYAALVERDAILA
ncbi:MAG: ATP-binding cassette, subfamily bacterial [Gaiellales bacterium]|jgi:ATP-binding cassette subfamily B protein|nr:ATP-binding cassette, subfamily bacterial [Gaiellales bacterium]